METIMPMIAFLVSNLLVAATAVLGTWAIKILFGIVTAAGGNTGD